MKLRPSSERKCSTGTGHSDNRNCLIMQPSSGHTPQTGNGDISSPRVPIPATRLPAEGSSVARHAKIYIPPSNSNTDTNSGSRHTRPTIRLQSHCVHSHSNSNNGGPEDSNDTDARENGSRNAKILHVYQWLNKMFPYILIFSVKLIVQHVTGISIGIGLLTTFLYANKCIVNQVFLRDVCSKLQCIWLIIFLSGVSVLLYYTFSSQALCYSLIFMNPTLGSLEFWDALWVVGITEFVGKFFFMGLKCFILLVPSFLISYKCKGYWYMCLEEIAEYYCILISTPVWFRYLISYGAQSSGAEWYFGILLALLYLILKFLVLLVQWKASRDILRLLFTQPTYGVAATKNQCSQADLCVICQTEFTKPIVLLCQHIFCEECISLWLIKETTCPFCRTVISSHTHKCKDGATSLQLRLF